MKNFTRIAMIATKEDWESIENYFSKDDILGINSRIDTEFPYLINYHDENDKFGIGHYNTVGSEAIHETFNAKIFLEACGIETDVYKITREQILFIANKSNSIIREYLSELFPEVGEEKKKLVVGKWYKKQTNMCDLLMNYQGNTNISYGFNTSKKYSNEYLMEDAKGWTEATQKEVEDALICEAKKRGYKKGVLVKPLWKTPLDSWNVYDNQIRFEGKSNVFYFGCCIFKDGIWATIIQPEKMTLEQIEKELGRKIELI